MQITADGNVALHLEEAGSCNLAVFPKTGYTLNLEQPA